MRVRFFDGPLAAYALLIGIGGVALLLSANLFEPGCSGPPAPSCDLLTTATQAAERRGRPISNTFGLVAYDLGALAYVTGGTAPGGILYEPAGALIDKQSCRVCRVDPHRKVIDGRVLVALPAGASPAADK